MSSVLDFDELKRKLDSLRETRAQEQRKIETVELNVQKFHADIKMLRDVNSDLQSTIENLSKSGASVELQETISQFQTELAKMDINFDKIKIPMKMPDNWDEELPETSDISIEGIEQEQRERIRELGILLRNEEIEVERLVDKGENVRLDMIRLKKEFHHEVELMLKLKCAPAEYPDNGNDA